MPEYGTTGEGKPKLQELARIVVVEMRLFEVDLGGQAVYCYTNVTDVIHCLESRFKQVPV